MKCIGLDLLNEDVFAQIMQAARRERHVLKTNFVTYSASIKLKVRQLGRAADVAIKIEMSLHHGLYTTDSHIR